MTELESYYLQEQPQLICGEVVPSIVDEYNENCPSAVDRFFTRYYYINPKKETEPQLVLFHSNRICLIGLAPDHVAFTRGIKSISFEVGKVDRGQNHVSGKKKSGGMIVQEGTALAQVTCEDGSVYSVRACVQGKLVEVNQRVVEDVGLLGVEGDGFVAIIMPKPEQCEAIKAKLTTREKP